jgi:4-hydroxythreonine-4-phosphate dehydrogenase
MSTPRIVITCGDVNGIGLRCLAMICNDRIIDAELTLAIDASTLSKAITRYDLPGRVDTASWVIGGNAIALLELGSPCDVHPGHPADDASRCAVASLSAAISRTVSGQFDAVVTLPINKHALARVGWTYPGQTEMLAEMAGGEALMVLCTRTLHVALATVHVPLRDVTGLLSESLITRRIRQLNDHLRLRLGIGQPRIAVLGLNPHASEGGQIGDEDLRIVSPAVESCRHLGVDVRGPFPSDGFFGFGSYRQYDGVLAMYHDQGLIPLKLLAKGAGVNVTAGLSIIRTSPDHGTAYDRATSSDIDAESTGLAITMAIEMSRVRGFRF